MWRRGLLASLSRANGGVVEGVSSWCEVGQLPLPRVVQSLTRSFSDLALSVDEACCHDYHKDSSDHPYYAIDYGWRHAARCLTREYCHRLVGMVDDTSVEEVILRARCSEERK